MIDFDHTNTHINVHRTQALQTTRPHSLHHARVYYTNDIAALTSSDDADGRNVFDWFHIPQVDLTEERLCNCGLAGFRLCKRHGDADGVLRGGLQSTKRNSVYERECDQA